MRCRKGFIIIEDEDTKKMTPLFVNVRSEDIIPTDTINISTALKPFSTKWTRERVFNEVDSTVYVYSGNWTGTLDPNGETVPSSKMDGELTYQFYKDGRYILDGDLRLAGTRSDDTDRYQYEKSFFLPFALPVQTTVLGSYTTGTCDGCSLVAVLGKDIIRNQYLNLNLADQNEYWAKCTFYQDTPITSGGIYQRLREADPEYDAEAQSLDDYYGELIPLHIHATGYWK